MNYKKVLKSILTLMLVCSLGMVPVYADSSDVQIENTAVESDADLASLNSEDQNADVLGQETEEENIESVDQTSDDQNTDLKNQESEEQGTEEQSTEEQNTEQSTEEPEQPEEKLEEPIQPEKETAKILLNVDEFTIRPIKDKTYTGKNITPAVEVVYKHKTADGKKAETVLINNVDYEVSFNDNKNVGTAKIIISGKGAYIGKITGSFTIKPRSLSSCGSAVLKYKSMAFNGDARTQSKETKVFADVSGIKHCLVYEKDYKISYTDNVNAGTASMKISGIGNYKGSFTVPFKISRRNIHSKCKVTVNNTKLFYTGEEVCPEVTVVCTGSGKKITLKKDEDYKVFYSNNVKPGTAIITIKGRGNLKGSITKKVAINHAILLNAASVTNQTLQLAEGKNYQLETTFASSKFSSGKVVWKSSNKNVASVNSKGTVTGKTPGKAIISASCHGETIKCTIQVNVPGMISIIDDDGRKTFMHKFLPIIEEKGVSIATAVTPNRIETIPERFMSWEQIAECEEAGAEVLCHTLMHHSGPETEAMSYEEILGEYQEASQIMKDHGFAGNVLVYSRSTGKVKKAREAASEVFDLGIISNGAEINYGDTDPYAYKRFAPLTYLINDPDQVKQWIDQVNQEGGWMIWVFHTYQHTLDQNALGVLGDMIDYSLESDVPIVSVADGMELMES